MCLAYIDNISDLIVPFDKEYICSFVVAIFVYLCINETFNYSSEKK